MKLEAIDPLHQSLMCVVTVAEVQGPRLRLHFDGYGDSHDFWEGADSENLFPAGWSAANNQRLTAPKARVYKIPTLISGGVGINKIHWLWGRKLKELWGKDRNYESRLK